MFDASRGLVGAGGDGRGLAPDASSSASVRGYDTWYARSWSGGSIETLTDGHDAQTVTILCDASAAFVSGAGNLRLASDYGPGVRGVLRLIYDRASNTWDEISRGANP